MLTLKIEHFNNEDNSGYSRVSSELNGSNPISLFDVTFSYGITVPVKEKQVEALEQIVRVWNNAELQATINETTIGQARTTALVESFDNKGN